VAIATIIITRIILQAAFAIYGGIAFLSCNILWGKHPGFGGAYL
jgi:hypothetical protein